MAFNKDLDYSIIEINSASENFGSKKIVVATKLIDQVLNECEIENYKQIQKIKGRDFEGTI